MYQVDYIKREWPFWEVQISNPQGAKLIFKGYKGQGVEEVWAKAKRKAKALAGDYGAGKKNLTLGTKTGPRRKYYEKARKLYEARH